MGRYGEIESSSRREEPPPPDPRVPPLAPVRHAGDCHVDGWGSFVRWRPTSRASSRGLGYRGYPERSIAPFLLNGYPCPPPDPRIPSRAARAKALREMWGDVGRCGEMWGDVGRCGEMRGDAGRYGEMRGDAGRCGEMRQSQRPSVRGHRGVYTLPGEGGARVPRGDVRRRRGRARRDRAENAPRTRRDRDEIAPRSRRDRDEITTRTRTRASPGGRRQPCAEA